MSSGLGELFVELGTIGNVKDLEKFVAKVKEGATAIEKHMKLNDNASKSTDNSLKGLISRVGKFKIAIATTVLLLNRLTNELVRNNQEFLKLTRQSDIALSTFNKWDSVGKMFGISNVAGQIENLNKRLFELRLTGQGASGFQLAGINPTGLDAEGVLERVRTRIQGMSNTQASYLLEQMGLDPSLITILRLGKKEFENLWQTIKRYNLTDKERKEIEKLNIQLQICSLKLKYLKDKVILAILPIWTKLVQSFTRVSEGLAMLVKWVKGIADIKLGVKTLGQVITSILIPALLTLMAIAHPIYALFMALYLIVDDYVGYLQGKDSVIGHILNAIDDFEDKLNFETPQWIKDLLLIIQNANKLGNLLNRGEKSDRVTVSGIASGITSALPSNVALNPINMGNTLQDFLIKKWGNGGILNNKETTINMTNNIVTDQPAETITNEVLYLQYNDALRG